MNDDPETIERLRQGVMRYRELLDILHSQIEQGEQAYAELMARLSPDDTDGLSEKAIQGLLAKQLSDDPTPLGEAALTMRWHMRYMERDFEQVYDNVMAS